MTRPEIDLLLTAARTHMDAEHAARMSDLVGRDLDWRYVQSAAEEHGLVPLLSRNLAALPAGVVADDAASVLRREAVLDAGRGLLLTAELLRLLQLFDAYGVPALPYKGPVLAALAYGSVTARSYSDLDIVVEPRHLPKVDECLTAAGYRSLGSAADQARSRRHRWHHQYERHDERVMVEIHWAFTYRSWRFARDLAPLWSRAETTVVAGEEVPTFARDDLVILLAMHGAKHFWERILWIVDLAELTRPEVGVDWDHVLAQATTTGTRRMVLIGLDLARDLLGTRLPSPVAAASAADPIAAELAARLGDRLRAGSPSRLTGVEASRFYLAMRERRREKIPYLLFPNDEDLSTVDLPAFLSPLYFVVRPLKLLTKYGTRRLRPGAEVR